MIIRYLITRHPVSAAVCGLAAAAMLVSGCGDSNTTKNDEHADHLGEPASAIEGAAHTHDAAGETCFICDPSKRDAGRLWCGEHGRYEDRCWLCHPELEEKTRLYCKEHFLYEDECFICHPELELDGPDAEPGESAEAAATEVHGATPALFCNEHGVPEIECAICQPDLAAALAPGESMQVRFPSIEAADKAGVRAERPGLADAAPGINAYCEVEFNLNRTARITPLAGGIIHEVRHDVGTTVSEGDVLVVLHSIAVAEVKSDYLTALVEHDIQRQTLERQRSLREERISAEREFFNAEAAYRTARLRLSNLRQNLLNLDFTGEEITAIETTQDASADLPIRAPFDGTLVARSAVVGEAADAGHDLFTLSDLSSHWLYLSVPANQAGEIRPGQNIEGRFAEFPGNTYRGRITWVDAAIDKRTRMIRARAEVSDPEGRLLSGLFGEARILTGEPQTVAVLPRDAVQKHAGGTFVFVPTEPDLFSLRRVSVGKADADQVHVFAGLAPEEPVVTEGGFIVMSEFLKSRLGAGCVHD
ncbi:MAG: efflux RND transporter periplasmic adaptor subunit [Verrucomicrobiota bacterium]|jgi:cobalt-zinc-cadmium efflux system membrane fusion protein|nr:efflux RND transporter periplasmic adaptor subunit [Verrucomicrobiota bacterium]MDI9385297.1 efflux RND transporter periplasmic adaptor subunit [Verrucomicrobiota bacterium]